MLAAAGLGGAVPAVIGVVLWGLGGRPGVRGQGRRHRYGGAGPAGLPFGLFDTGFGVCRFAGSLALGTLYDRSATGLVAFSVVLQLAALPLLLAVRTER
ncbi:hypothetical protein ACF09J_19955 [Streptomyces sp. NPDC014889]|uniref:hypothetical protein n=1 Tax=Streptomyces sp. NPDC014889 TaxID=3364928 RepID=UPI0036F77BD9